MISTAKEFKLFMEFLEGYPDVSQLKIGKIMFNFDYYCQFSLSRYFELQNKFLVKYPSFPIPEFSNAEDFIFKIIKNL